ncbi:PEP/pyruvate-binding domain-containing protein [Streptomyces iconiensis]|uniref:PEP/pyruvate-binding domain-containing protein n=1 Tax=Streptomyces iconiensis TaxID=1384038 RepID=A0ABT6ZZF7_9ACTN|nr:PEP/pyruvate-binding domain-containing protein [Streptomyces iconiensis]MDJ1134462.1 PEP/pyruvate-binding domain-containing protein [Streptomyces iconiensis]
MTPAILSLDDRRTERGPVGAKAHTLARLRRHGFQVPDGFVLTAGFPTPGAPGAFPPQEASARARLAAACRAWIGPDPDVPLAVRSSARAEDGPALSYAGQFVSVLDVRGTDALAAAVARCRAGASDGRAERYRRRMDGREERTNGHRGEGEAEDAGEGENGGEGGASAPVAPAMPVLVQRMVRPEWAGVLFSVDPVRPDPAVLVVDAAPESAASVCDGTANPLRYRVDRVSLTVLDGPGPDAGPAPGTALIAEVARTGLALERVLGGPQDVEWATDSGAVPEVTVLQSRAVTTLPTSSGPAATVAETLSWL